ncbi:MAG: SDR family NAD(P)-dependent oxidoreductase [Flavobacteriales bacterium]|nr:SDR family NAD(P)-dependent oxidoreductase [Flavobacteriales bacterium]
MKYVVISGVSRGLGRELAIQFHRNHYAVIAYARDEKALNDLKEELLSKNACPVFLFKVDAMVKSEVQQFAAEVKKICTSPDVIVNNVAQYTENAISEENFDTLEEQMKINFYSAWWLTHPFLNELKQRKQGHIFNICSVVSVKPRYNAAAYSISKGALKFFNDVLKEEMNLYNVKVTAVLPGSINTSSWDGVDAPKAAFVQPADIAALMLHILKNPSPANIDEIVINPQLKGY